MQGFEPRRGFSLLEAAIVLGVVGVITAGLMTLMSSTNSAANASRTIQQIDLTVKSVRNYFITRALPSTATDASTNYTSAVMRAAGVFPEDTCPANCVSGSVTNVFNAYNGTITFSLPTTATIPDANRFKLVLTNIAKYGCVQLGLTFGNDAVNRGLYSFDANGTAYTTFPITLANLNTACSSATANTVTLIFYINT